MIWTYNVIINVITYTEFRIPSTTHISLCDFISKQLITITLFILNNPHCNITRYNQQKLPYALHTTSQIIMLGNSIENVI